MKSVDVSFIVPVYNTDKVKLLRCFESIQGITVLVYEVIIVDDGSNKPTAKFCQDYASEHGGFVYCRKKNGGVSSARNIGISEAKGKFIYFVDADDELIPTAFKRDWIELQVDIIITDIKLNHKNSKTTFKALEGSEGIIKPEEYIFNILNNGVLLGPCSKLYKKSYIISHNIWFNTKMILGEDAVFSFELMLYHPILFYADTCTYIYWFSANTGKSRLINSPEAIIENNIDMDKKFREIIDVITKNSDNKEKLLRLVMSRFIKQMFNVAASLKVEKLLKVKYQNQITQIVREADKMTVHQCNRGIRIRHWILTKPAWSVLACVAMVRSAYLKAVGKN